MERIAVVKLLKRLVDEDPNMCVPNGVTAEVDGEGSEYPALVIKTSDGQTFVLDIEEGD